MTKTFRTNIVSGALAAAMSLSVPAPVLAFGFGGGGIPSDIATDSNLSNVGSNIVAEVQSMIETAILQTGQLSGNLKEQISSEANMRQLADERQRQREVERQKFEALKNSAVSQQECVIRTRVSESQVFNRPEKRLSAQTLNTLEQLASWNLGTPVGNSGAPRPYSSREEKAEIELMDQAGKHCDPALASQGYCSEPVAPELQGVNYESGKSIFSSINYSSDEVVEGCKSLAHNVTGLGGEGIPNTTSQQTPNSATKQRAIFTSTSRMSMARKVIVDYCMDRAPSANEDDPSNERLLDTASKMPGYNTGELEENGISYMMGFQIRSQEWMSKLDGDREYTDVALLKEVAMTLGWMAHQNNEIYKKIDKLGVLQAATLGAINEGVSVQREQLEGNDAIIDAITSN